jgi:hypothetical protein
LVLADDAEDRAEARDERRLPGGIRFSTKHTDLCFPSFFACYPSSSLRSVTHEEIIMTRERLQILKFAKAMIGSLPITSAHWAAHSGSHAAT